MIQLEILDPSGKRKRWSSARQTAIIGRSEICDLTLESDLASRRHAQLHFDGHVVRLTDLSSANGTFLNGHHVEAPVVLQVGDEIGIGQAGPRLRVIALDTPPLPASQRGTEPALQRPTPSAARNGNDRPVVSSVSSRRPSISTVDSSQHTAPANKAMRLVVAAFALLILAVAFGGWFALARWASMPGNNIQTARDTSDGRDSDKTVLSTLSIESSTTQGVSRQSPPGKAQLGQQSEGLPKSLGHQLPPKTPADFAKEAIVWLGWEAEGFRVPICTAWAITPNQLVITAQMAGYLDQQRKSDKRIHLFAYDPSREEAIALVDLRSHPRYLLDDPGAQRSLHHNVGLAVLEKPLSASLTLLPEGAGLSALGNGQPVRVVGYAITREMQQRPFDPISPPVLTTREGEISSGDLASGDIPFPRRVLKIPHTPGLSGSPVLGPDGSVLAIVHQTNEKTYGIIAPVIRDLLEHR